MWLQLCQVCSSKTLGVELWAGAFEKVKIFLNKESFFKQIQAAWIYILMISVSFVHWITFCLCRFAVPTAAFWNPNIHFETLKCVCFPPLNHIKMCLWSTLVEEDYWLSNQRLRGWCVEQRHLCEAPLCRSVEEIHRWFLLDSPFLSSVTTDSTTLL